MAYLPSCSTRINANFLILPLWRPRVVKMTTGQLVPASVLASRPSVASYRSTCSRVCFRGLGSYSPVSGTGPS
jgi:hypothetical protein